MINTMYGYFYGEEKGGECGKLGFPDHVHLNFISFSKKNGFDGKKERGGGEGGR